MMQNVHYELMPFKNLQSELPALPPGASVSLTCSPNKGNDHTFEVCRQLIASGFDVTPHVSARMVQSRAHLRELIAHGRASGIHRWFVVGGDADVAGPYPDGHALLTDLFAEPHGLSSIGVPSYPDGHPSIDDSSLVGALHTKQALITQAGLPGWTSTQLCFSSKIISTWLRRERAAGLTLPVRAGAAGPVERTKLLTLGMKVGVGQSLRYLRKQGVGLLSGRYDPSVLVAELEPVAAELGIEGVHLFTFNQLAAAVKWHEAAAS